jgi:hypothetical protein
MDKGAEAIGNIVEVYENQKSSRYNIHNGFDGYVFRLVELKRIQTQRAAFRPFA